MTDRVTPRSRLACLFFSLPLGEAIPGVFVSPDHPIASAAPDRSCA